jgi:hypothetical protein
MRRCNWLVVSILAALCAAFYLGWLEPRKRHREFRRSVGVELSTLAREKELRSVSGTFLIPAFGLAGRGMPQKRFLTSFLFSGSQLLCWVNGKLNRCFGGLGDGMFGGAAGQSGQVFSRLGNIGVGKQPDRAKRPKSLGRRRVWRLGQEIGRSPASFRRHFATQGSAQGGTGQGTKLFQVTAGFFADGEFVVTELSDQLDDRRFVGRGHRGKVLAKER